MGFYTKKPLRSDPRLKGLVFLCVLLSLLGIFWFYTTMTIREAQAEVLFQSTPETENIKVGDLQTSFFFNPRIVTQVGIGTTPTKIKIKIARFGESTDPLCKYRFQGFRYLFLPNEGDSGDVGRVPQPLLETVNVIESTMPVPGSFFELTIPIFPDHQFVWGSTDFVEIEFGNNSCQDRAPLLFKGTQNQVAQNFITGANFIVTFACTFLEFNCPTTKISFTIEDDVPPPPPPQPPVILSPASGSFSESGIFNVTGSCAVDTGFDVISIRAIQDLDGEFVVGKAFAICVGGSFLTFAPMQLFQGDFILRGFACDDLAETTCTGSVGDVLLTVQFGGAEPISPIFVDQDFGFLGNKLFDLLKFLFLPTEDTFDPLQELITFIRSKPPLGFFDIIKNSIGGIGTTTPAFALTGLSGISTVLSPLKIGISFILWTLFSFWLFRKITSFEL